MQSRAGRDFLARHGYPLDRYETFLVVSGGRCYEKSDAALLTAQVGSTRLTRISVLKYQTL